MPTRSELLSNVPFFALLDDQERATLADRIDVVTVSAGTSLFNRGDPGDSMYVVLKGVVEMWFKNDIGERLVLETAREGDFFGEISLLDGGPRNTAALVSTSQRDTGSRARPVGGLVVRRTSRQAAKRLWTGGASTDGGWRSLTCVIVSTGHAVERTRARMAPRGPVVEIQPCQIRRITTT